MQLLITLSLLFALAGRVLSLNITFGTTNGLQPGDLLSINDPDLNSACRTQCDTANSAIKACSDDDCLCAASTVQSFVACEQCMFSTLITSNKPKPDPRAGSVPAIQAYAAACKDGVNVTIPPTDLGLTLPSNWDGPFVSVLSIPLAIIYALFGGALGGSIIFLLSNM